MKSFLVHQTINRKNLDKSFKRILRTRPIRKHQEKKKKSSFKHDPKLLLLLLLFKLFSQIERKQFSFLITCFLFLRLSATVFVSLSPRVSLYQSLTVSVHLCLSVYSCVCLSASIYLTMFLPLSISLSSLLLSLFFQEIQCSFIFAAWLALPRCQSECEVFAFSFRVESKN